MPARNPLPDNTSVRDTRGMECPERMDGRTQFCAFSLANNIVARKRSHPLFGQIRTKHIGHHHIGSLDTTSPRNFNKCINIMLHG